MVTWHSSSAVWSEVSSLTLEKSPLAFLEAWKLLLACDQESCNAKETYNRWLNRDGLDFEKKNKQVKNTEMPDSRSKISTFK